MKYLITLVALVLFSTSTMAFIGAPMGGAYNAKGAVKRYDQVWVSVKNLSGQTISKGSAVVLDFSTPTVDGIAITLPTIVGEPAHCVTMEQLTSNEVGKCQVWGYIDTLRFAEEYGTATAGASLYITGMTNGTGEAGTVAGIGSDSVKAWMQPVGYSYYAHDSSGNIEAFINTLR